MPPKRTERARGTRVRQCDPPAHPSNPDPTTTCERCRSPLSDSDRYCPSCKHDAGAPNVRECGTAAERSAVKKRAGRAEHEAKRNGCARAFAALEDLLKKKSGVVVTVPAAIARNIVTDPRQVFANYEELVGGGKRLAAPLHDDKHRRAVCGTLFGSYGDKIRYGVLSLTNAGLPTYGDICFRLRDIAVQDRVSFLETNSYDFVVEHAIVPGTPIPAGHRAVWDNRHLLALAKLGPRLNKDRSVAHQNLLVTSDDLNRSSDDFIEAHIFDSFGVHAIQGVERSSESPKSKETELDIKITLEKFESIGGKVS